MVRVKDGLRHDVSCLIGFRENKCSITAKMKRDANYPTIVDFRLHESRHSKNIRSISRLTASLSSELAALESLSFEDFLFVSFRESEDCDLSFFLICDLPSSLTSFSDSLSVPRFLGFDLI